jgi:hypothetical protein
MGSLYQDIATRLAAGTISTSQAMVDVMAYPLPGVGSPNYGVIVGDQFRLIKALDQRSKLEAEVGRLPGLTAGAQVQTPAPTRTRFLLMKSRRWNLDYRMAG